MLLGWIQTRTKVARQEDLLVLFNNYLWNKNQFDN